MGKLHQMLQHLLSVFHSNTLDRDTALHDAEVGFKQEVADRMHAIEAHLGLAPEAAPAAALQPSTTAAQEAPIPEITIDPPPPNPPVEADHPSEAAHHETADASEQP